MNPDMTPAQSLHLMQRIITASLRELAYDLTQRQLGILLTVYLEPPPHTVANLSSRLMVSKPAICRGLDTLSKLDFIRRKKDERDRRVVYLQRTVAGSVFLRDLADIILREQKSTRAMPQETAA